MLERLQKFLARAGVASRRRAEELIDAGRVTVNGVVIRKMGSKVDPAKDEVRLDTEIVRSVLLPRDRAAAAAPAPAASARPAPTAAAFASAGVAPAGPRSAGQAPRAVYLLLNKPVGFLSTVSDDRGRRTVMELLPRIRERVFPVGRLDEDSEGLLLLTNDGDLANLLTHPRYEVPKTYDLRVRGEVTPEDVLQVERGVWLSEGRTAPSHMRIRRRGRDISHIELILREGRNREIRRIFARLKHPVLSLRRVSLGPVELAGLRLGQIRRLSPEEVKDLYRAARQGAEAPAKPLRPHARRRLAGGARGPQGESRPFRSSARGAPDKRGFDRPASEHRGFEKGRPAKPGFDKRSPNKRGFDKPGFDKRSPNKRGFDKPRPHEGGPGGRGPGRSGPGKPPFRRKGPGR